MKLSHYMVVFWSISCMFGCGTEDLKTNQWGVREADRSADMQQAQDASRQPEDLSESQDSKEVKRVSTVAISVLTVKSSTDTTYYKELGEVLDPERCRISSPKSASKYDRSSFFSRIDPAKLHEIPTQKRHGIGFLFYDVDSLTRMPLSAVQVDACRTAQITQGCAHPKVFQSCSWSKEGDIAQRFSTTNVVYSGTRESPDGALNFDILLPNQDTIRVVGDNVPFARDAACINKTCPLVRLRASSSGKTWSLQQGSWIRVRPRRLEYTLFNPHIAPDPLGEYTNVVEFSLKLTSGSESLHLWGAQGF